MPIYEYQCRDCGARFEKIVPFSQADSTPTCPHCDSPDTRKQISIFAASGPSAGDAGDSSSSCGLGGGFT